jgi:hypothetical protein
MELPEVDIYIMEIQMNLLTDVMIILDREHGQQLPVDQIQKISVHLEVAVMKKDS